MCTSISIWFSGFLLALLEGRAHAAASWAIMKGNGSWAQKDMTNHKQNTHSHTQGKKYIIEICEHPKIDVNNILYIQYIYIYVNPRGFPLLSGSFWLWLLYPIGSIGSVGLTMCISYRHLTAWCKSHAALLGWQRAAWTGYTAGACGAPGSPAAGWMWWFLTGFWWA